MMYERYTPSEIEPKWQAYWDANKTFATSTDPAKPKKYVLDMFPYPSGAGLHVGHPEGYTATDIICRALRAQGHAVLHPMGWDAFGLPAEQYAIQTGVHPRVTTEKNINTFRRQIKALGLSYDWDREVDTTDPAYVKWTQWIFLQLFKRGLAYQTEKPVNWCPALGTVLANEEVIDGKSERGQHPVVRLPLRQWMLKITAYADRLAADLDQVKWPDSTKTMQEEWIGRSEGAEVIFTLDGHEGQLEVFTTRPDTLFGATFMVVAPEHPVVEQITTADRKAEVEAYVAAAKNRSELDRRAAKEKTGVFTGAYAINPVNGAKVPVWTADYVLWGYGTGAIMAVPAHDERDFAFATKFGIPVIEVVSPTGTPRTEPLTEAFCEEGIAVNSGAYDGLKTADFKAKITADLDAKGQGSLRVEYKLRDWVFSRQRYWGEPFPIYFPVTCEGDPRQGGDFTIHYETPIALEESELPLLLPEMEDFSPGDDPAGCLARATDWRFFQRDGQWYARETNTMPQWAGSCWYYLRYIDPKNPEAAWSKEAADRWLPVDLYVGGAEHAVLHLLYARFWHKVLFDCGHITCPEPFTRLVHQGMILGEVEYTRFFTMDGQPVSKEQVSFLEGGGLRHKATGEDLKSERVSEEHITKKGTEFVMKDAPEIVIDGRAFKMSKSRGNVINPDDVIQAHGADALRLYEMFMGPLEAAKPWSTGGIQGVSRFLDRVWAIGHRDLCEETPDALLRLTHKTIQKVTQDIETLGMNTAISALMIYINELPKDGLLPRYCVETLVQLVHPFAPHIAEELWERLGHKESIQLAPWPTFDPALCVASEVEVPVQVNGKVRGKLLLPVGVTQADAQAAALADAGVQKHLEGKTLVKVIWVQDKLMSLVVK